MKPASLSDNIIYLCNDFSHRFALLLSRRFEEKGIPVTPEQFAILVILLYRDGITQKEISENLNRDKTTIARVVNNMKKKGIVRQVTDESDNRAKLIYLTKEGRMLQQEALNVSGEVYMQLMDGVDKINLKAGIQLLHQMLGKL
jgi:DNA-binding MarR family transcriptional regulator